MAVLFLSCKGINNPNSDKGFLSEKANGMDKATFDSIASIIMNKNRVGILKIHLENDTIQIISDRNLAWKPLGILLNDEELKMKFFRQAIMRDTVIWDSGVEERRNGLFISTANSTLFFLRLDDVRSAEESDDKLKVLKTVIRDTIPLAYDIKVGMTRKDFFNRVFGYYNNSLFQMINVVISSDPPGEELDTYFVFNKERLEEVRMERPF